MTIEETRPDAPELPDESQGHSAAPESGSLAERMQEYRADLQNQRTVILPVTGYTKFLAAEYRALPYTEIRATVTKHSRQPNEALRELLVAAEQLILACEDVYEVNPNGTRTSLGLTWGAELARRLGWNVPETTTDRQALLGYIFEGHDTWLLQHSQEWTEWQQGEDQTVDEEMVRDFGTTQ